MRAHRAAAATFVAMILSMSLATGVAEAGGWAGPTVISGWKNGPVTISNSGAWADVASLTLPAGRWVAWAKLYVDNTTTGGAQVTCVLAASGFDPNDVGHQGIVVIGSQAGSDVPSAQPLALSAYAKFGTGGGDFSLSCRAGDVYGSPALAAHWFKIMAMQAGKVTTVNMATNAATNAGSGKPAITMGWLTGPTSIPNRKSVTVARLRLGRGQWWLHASFMLQEADQGWAKCKLKVGRRTYDATVEQVGQGIVATVMDAAIHLSAGQSAKVACKGGTLAATYGSQYASDVHLTAVKLGELQIWGDKSGNYGSGKPRATALADSPAYSLANQAWTEQDVVGLAAGHWMIMAKAFLASDQPLVCKLTAEADYDQTAIGSWGDLTLPLAVVHTFSDWGEAGYACRPSGTGASSDSHVRLTAIKLGSLTNEALP
jgi:hypothetical protein